MFGLFAVLVVVGAIMVCVAIANRRRSAPHVDYLGTDNDVPAFFHGADFGGSHGDSGGGTDCSSGSDGGASGCDGGGGH